MNEPQLQQWEIDVFDESPVWDRYERWFMVPQYILDELYVTTYVIKGEWIDESDIKRHVAEVRRAHPTSVLVY